MAGKGIVMAGIF